MGTEWGRGLAERETAESGLPLTAEAVRRMNTSLCESRTEKEMVSVGGLIQTDSPKFMFFESARHCIVHNPPGLCKMSPPAVLNFVFFWPSSHFCSEDLCSFL